MPWSQAPEQFSIDEVESFRGKHNLPITLTNQEVIEAYQETTVWACHILRCRCRVLIKNLLESIRDALSV